jgi:hypothetical protein
VAGHDILLGSSNTTLRNKSLQLLYYITESTKMIIFLRFLTREINIDAQLGDKVKLGIKSKRMKSSDTSLRLKAHSYMDQRDRMNRELLAPSERFAAVGLGPNKCFCVRRTEMIKVYFAYCNTNRPP